MEIRQNVNEGTANAVKSLEVNKITNEVPENSFSVFCSILNEKALTEALKYLLDSKQPHKLEHRFFYAFMRLLPQKFKSDRGLYAVASIGQWDTESGRKVDILVVAKQNWECAPSMVIGIEGKIDAPESKNQISDYQKALSGTFTNIKPLLVFLTRSGEKPHSANSRSRCNVVSLSWKQIARICRHKEFKDNKFCQDFAAHIRMYISPISKTPKRGEAYSFFYKRLLPQIRQTLSVEQSELKIEWSNPKKSPPNEFNFSHRSINSIINEEIVNFYYMFISPGGSPMVGRQVHLLIMAWPGKKFRPRKDAKRLSELRKLMPPLEGGKREWPDWTFIWSAGFVTLSDLGQYDLNALGSLYKGAYSRTADKLREGIQTLWREELR